LELGLFAMLSDSLTHGEDPLHLQLVMRFLYVFLDDLPSYPKILQLMESYDIQGKLELLLLHSNDTVHQQAVELLDSLLQAQQQERKQPPPSTTLISS
jgi:hypothetical protein